MSCASVTRWNTILKAIHSSSITSASKKSGPTNVSKIKIKKINSLMMTRTQILPQIKTNIMIEIQKKTLKGKEKNIMIVDTNTEKIMTTKKKRDKK